MSCSKENRKIINRFFKEIGLFNLWENYIFYEHDKYALRVGQYPFDPFKHDKMDSVIGCTYISKYIREKMNVDFKPNIVFHFRMYISEKHPELVSTLKYSEDFRNANEKHMWLDGKYLIEGIHYKKL